MKLSLNDLSVLEYELEPFREIGSGRCIQQITISKIMTRSGNKWGVYMGDSWILGKKEKFFIYNCIPSSRTDEFTENSYFDSAEDALKFWLKNKEYILQELIKCE